MEEEATNGNNNGDQRMMVKATSQEDHIADKKKKKKKESDNDDDDDEQIHLKNMIATHPLYGLLIQSHFNCLKVGLDEIEEYDKENDIAEKQIYNSQPKATSPPSSSELDHFMEAYCIALSKLKEAIEEPTRETKAFINATYIELKDLTDDQNNYNNNNSNNIIIEDPNDDHLPQHHSDDS